MSHHALTKHQGFQVAESIGLIDQIVWIAEFHHVPEKHKSPVQRVAAAAKNGVRPANTCAHSTTRSTITFSTKDAVRRANDERDQEVTEKQKRILIVALVIHVIMLSLTWRDLSRRPDGAVRGKKRMWQLASLLNTSGSVTYWLFGRRPVKERELVLVRTEA
jgi:hypothetical protein